MARTLEREQARTEAPSSASIEERVRRVPSVEEVRALVEGPGRRPVHWMRWMRWLGLFVILAGGAVVAALLITNDDETATVLGPQPEAGGPTQAEYLPETSGQVYNYNPTMLATVDPDLEAGGPVAQDYLPATSGEVYNHNPTVVVVPELIGYDEAGQPYYSHWGPVAVAAPEVIGYDEAGLPYYSHWGVVGYDEAGLPYYNAWS